MPSADASFLPLFLAHQPALYAFVLANGIAPADADDVIQNVAVVLWQRYAEFRPGSDFRAWAYAVTRLELRKQGDRWRRDQRVLRRGHDLVGGAPGAATPPPTLFVEATVMLRPSSSLKGCSRSLNRERNCEGDQRLWRSRVPRPS